jgi:MFS family permease
MAVAPPKHHMVLAFVALCVWNLMVAIDATALAIALPVRFTAAVLLNSGLIKSLLFKSSTDESQTVARDLHSDSTAIYWAGTAFVLCSAVFQPIFASIAAFGHKTSIVIALTFFTCGSLVCALARSAAMLIAGRCLQGTGGGGLIILTYVIMAHLFTLQERSKYTSIIGLIWTVGTVFGPLIGGGFAQVDWVRQATCEYYTPQLILLSSEVFFG